MAATNRSLKLNIMDNKDTTNRQDLPAEAKTELAYYIGRNITITILSLGSMIVTYRIGGMVGEMISASPTVSFFTKNIFVMLGLGVDFILINALGAVSMPQKSSKILWILVVSSLVVTLSLSVVSNSFVSEETSGRSHLYSLNESIESARKQDSIIKLKSLSLLEDAGGEEKQRVSDASIQAVQLLNNAISKGSDSWQKDYQNHKNNLRGWFWVCTKCPKEYRNYREGIIKAKSDGAQLIEDARGYTSQIADLLSPTLSYDLMQDTTLQSLQSTTLLLEDGRKTKAKRLNMILMVFTFGGAVLTIILSLALNDQRQKNGQHIKEDHIGPLLLVFDFASKAIDMLVDVIHNVLVRPWEWLRSKDFVHAYAVANSRWLHVAQDTNNQQQTNNNNQQQQQPTDNTDQQPTDTNNQQETETTQSSDHQEEKPTGNTDQQHKKKKACKTGKCSIDKRGKNMTVTNKKLTANAEELIKTAERCRTRYKRSFAKNKEDANKRADTITRNREGADEDAAFLKKHGAQVTFNKSTKKVNIELPKK